MRRVPIILLVLLLLPIVYAADLESISQTNRDVELGNIIIAQQEETRASIEQFGIETNKQFEIQKNLALKEINSTLLKFKFTLGIIIFCAFLAALEINSLLHRRRKRHIKRFDAEEARRLQ